VNAAELAFDLKMQKEQGLLGISPFHPCRVQQAACALVVEAPTYFDITRERRIQGLPSSDSPIEDGPFEALGVILIWHSKCPFESTKALGKGTNNKDCHNSQVRNHDYILIRLCHETFFEPGNHLEEYSKHTVLAPLPTTAGNRISRTPVEDLLHDE